MLKTNSKKAIENLHNYIRNSSMDYIEDNYGIEPEAVSTKKALYSFIWECFIAEKIKPNSDYAKRFPLQVLFENWGSGLAMGGLFDYYLAQAVDTLGDILEQTETERNRYTESEAEKCLTSLIYREVSKWANK